MNRNVFDLARHTAVVTGGSSGIGREIAQALAVFGASVVVVGRDSTRLIATVEQISDDGGQAKFVQCDLTRPGAVEAVLADISACFGSPDILFNAAGVNLRQPADDITYESWDTTLTLNLKVPFFLARGMVPAMKEKNWGRIINIGSLQSVRAFADSISYGASKGGIVQLTRAMAEAWSRSGIMCNAIAPGLLPTEMTKAVYASPDKVDAYVSQTAVRRPGTLEDVCGTAVFLASAAADYVTGQTIFVDGGYTAR